MNKSKTTKTALFIGRFQPFHNGHLDAIWQIKEKTIIIGVGSSQYSGKADNPYSFNKRKKMIETAVGNDLYYLVIAIPDIHNDKKWVKHVEKIVGDFDVVYTGNERVKKLFKDKNYKVIMIKKNIDISATELRNEISRLYEKLKPTCYTEEDCEKIAPLTLEINKLKKQQSAIILAHSYQTPDIMYGVADYIGDSYGLSKIATQTKAKKIIFCSVYFMGETAKILNPKKEVLIPTISGCSLAESITAKDVKKLKKLYPKTPVVCYINTYAEVKAEADVVCTSANALRIINSLPQDEIIFIPDKLMGQNLQKLTKKRLILWDGTCIVHEEFNASSILRLKKQYPNAKILAHTECNPAVIDYTDLAGSTTDIVNYVKNNKNQDVMLITECGITDRIRTEYPDRNIVGTCNLCPYMKKIKLTDILQALKKPNKKQIVKIDNNILSKARKALNRMMAIT